MGASLEGLAKQGLDRSVRTLERYRGFAWQHYLDAIELARRVVKVEAEKEPTETGAGTLGPSTASASTSA